MKHVEAGHAFARNLDNDYYNAYYYEIKAECLLDLATYSEAQLYHDSAIVLYDRLIKLAIDDPKAEAKYKLGKTNFLIGKGLVAAKQYRYHESFQYYLEGIAGIENMPGKEKNDLMATLYLDIASNYYELEQFEESLKYDKQILPYLDSNANIDMYVIGNLFSQLQTISAAFHNLILRPRYLETVRPIVVRLNKPSLDVRFYYILGTIQRKKNEWTDALISFQKANDAAKKMKDEFQVLNSAEGMAAGYFHLGNLNKAREIALLVLNESYRIKVPFGQVQALQLLASIEEKAGNIVKAHQYQKQFITVSDSIKKEKTQRQMNDAEMKYQNEKKQQEIVQLEKSKADTISFATTKINA